MHQSLHENIAFKHGSGSIEIEYKINFFLNYHFLNVKTSTLNLRKTFSDDVFNVLENYDWPGNVRELENVVERLIVTSRSNNVCISNIPQYILDSIEKAKKSYK